MQLAVMKRSPLNSRSYSKQTKNEQTVFNMCDLMNQLRKALLVARKKKDIQTQLILSTVVGELQNDEKRYGGINEEHIVRYLKKNVATLEQHFHLLNEDQLRLAEYEVELLESFLPKQLTPSDITSIIEEQVGKGVNTLPLIMKHFKENYAGRYDGRIASEEAKRLTV